MSLVFGLERMTIGVERDPSLVALLIWCLFFAPGGGGIYGLHARGGQCQRTKNGTLVKKTLKNVKRSVNHV